MSNTETMRVCRVPNGCGYVKAQAMGSYGLIALPLDRDFGHEDFEPLGEFEGVLRPAEATDGGDFWTPDPREDLVFEFEHEGRTRRAYA